MKTVNVSFGSVERTLSTTRSARRRGLSFSSKMSAEQFVTVIDVWASIQITLHTANVNVSEFEYLGTLITWDGD